MHMSICAPLLGPARLVRDSRRAWPEWLSLFLWTHWVTLTTEYPMSEDRLHRVALLMVRELARLTGGPVPCFYVIEESAAGQLHVHMLLGATHRLSDMEVASRWASKFKGKWVSLGRTDVHQYDRRLGARFYMTKYMSNVDGVADDRYYISGRLPEW